MAAEGLKDKATEDLTIEDARELNKHLAVDFLGNYLLGVGSLEQRRLAVLEEAGKTLDAVDGNKIDEATYAKIEDIAAELIFLEEQQRARYASIKDYIESHGAEVAGSPESYKRLRELALDDLKTHQAAASELSPEDLEAFRGMFGKDTPTV